MTTLWFVAGEASGDARAAEVMNVLGAIAPEIRFLGAGGPKMRAIAADPFEDWIAEAGVLGLWDVLKHYGYFRQKFHRMIEQIEETKPDAIVLGRLSRIQSPAGKALRTRRFPGKILYYISPQVWAWNRGRIPKMARLLDLMICVFPFEQPMYEASGLHTVFVGHPLLEALAAERIRRRSRRKSPRTLPRQPRTGGEANIPHNGRSEPLNPATKAGRPS